MVNLEQASVCKMVLHNTCPCVALSLSLSSSLSLLCIVTKVSADAYHAFNRFAAQIDEEEEVHARVVLELDVFVEADAVLV